MEMKLKAFFGLIVIMMVAVAAGLNTAEAHGPKGHKPGKSATQKGLIQWRTLEKGKAEAARRHMPVLVDFYSEADCPRCSRLDKEVYTNQSVFEKMKAHFVPVRVYKNNPLTHEEQALMDELKSGGECILAFLDAEGNIVKDDDGVQVSTMEEIPLDTYHYYMDQALKYVSQE